MMLNREGTTWSEPLFGGFCREQGKRKPPVADAAVPRARPVAPRALPHLREASREANAGRDRQLRALAEALSIFHHRTWRCTGDARRSRAMDRRGSDSSEAPQGGHRCFEGGI